MTEAESLIFSASRIKIKRARKFIQELRDLEASYKSDNPATAELDTSTMPPRITVNYKAVPDEPGAIIGDAIHNLRTALDLMASQLARLRNKSDKNVYFPFSEQASSFDEMLKKRNFHKAGDDAVKLLKKFQPYRGGNEMLRLIHDLDIQDKHTSIICNGRHMVLDIIGAIDRTNISSHWFSVSPDSITFVFVDNPVVDARPVIETLENLVQIVEGILVAFERMIALRNAT